MSKSQIANARKEIQKEARQQTKTTAEEIVITVSGNDVMCK